MLSIVIGRKPNFYRRCRSNTGTLHLCQVGSSPFDMALYASDLINEAIVTALSSIELTRLTLTFGRLDHKSRSNLTKLKSYMDSKDNFSAYRKALKKSTNPCIPWLGEKIIARSLFPIEHHVAIHIHDLHTTVSQSHDEVDVNGTTMINFEKWRRLHLAARDFLDYRPPDTSHDCQSGFVAYFQDRLRDITVGPTADEDFERLSKKLEAVEDDMHERRTSDLELLGIR